MNGKPVPCSSKDGWVEKIIEAVKAARPNATSKVLDNPLWGGTGEKRV